MTRQQITRLVADASEPGIRKVLRRLADQGIVLEQRVGTQYTYLANRDHLMWPAVEAASTLTERLDGQIRSHVESWSTTAISVELFGSAATGRATSDSDIDLILYRPHLTEDEQVTWDGQVADLRSAVERWTGNPCEIVEIDPRALIEMAAENEPVLRSPMQAISGIRLATAVPSTPLAKALREASQAGTAPRLPESTRRNLADSVMTPGLRRTLEELTKSTNAPLRAAIEKALRSER